MYKIGIFGGAFDPIHKGHIQVAKEALTVCDEVLMVPCLVSRYDKNMVSYNERCNMVHMVTRHYGDSIRLSHLELDENVKGKTYDLMRAGKDKYKGVELFCIIGSDTVDKIKDWYKWKELVTEFRFIIVKRKCDHINQSDESWYQKSKHKILESRVVNNFTSTYIRKKIQQNEFSSVQSLLHPSISNYICEEQLYKEE